MMVSWIDLCEVFITTAIISYLITPLCRRVAFITNYLDHPKDTKAHAHPTALLGGVGIYIAFMVGLFTTIRLGQDSRLLGIVVGSTVLLVVGLIDDRLGMMPEVKLLAQFLAAMALVKCGVRIEFFRHYYLAVVLTYVWVVGVTNAFNLLDNLNGLSAGVACISSLFFGATMWMDKRFEIAAIAFALGGSCLGFLRHNFPRARIFMGDTGSLMIGFVAASLALLGDWNTIEFSKSLAIPLIILGYPIFDTVLVIVMRVLEGRSIFQGGKDHSSHRLALLRLRKKRAVLVIYALCAGLGICALLVKALPLKPAMVVVAIVAASALGLGVRLGMVTTGRFGRKKGKSDY